MTLHNAESSEGFNIALKKVRGEKKKRKRKRSYYNNGYSYLVTHLSPIITNPAEQGLILLGERDMSLWYSDTTMNGRFISNKRKGNKEGKKSLVLVQWYNAAILLPWIKYRFLSDHQSK